MIRKILLQNKAFYIIILVFIIFFSLVLYFSSRRIYERESKWRDESGTSMLNLAIGSIETVLNNYNHHLSFLKRLPTIKGFVESSFASNDHRHETLKIFYKFANVTTEIYQISIINTSGLEIVKIEKTKDGNKSIVPFSELYARNNHYHFKQIANIDNTKNIASIDLNYQQDRANKTAISVMHISTALIDDNGDLKGSLILTINLSKIMEQLPKKIFLQTMEGQLVRLNSDGDILVEKSNYKFHARKGQIKISSTDNVHFSTFQLSIENELIVALHHSHIGLKTDLQKVTLFSIIMMGIFLSFIGVISFFNISRLKDKDRAQRALISSLVELTDWRDHETGDHLQRTKQYSRELAIQLRDNKKYRNMVTDQFIKDLYDTSPLHDIGKVGIKDSILLKKGKLTSSEMETMKDHVRIGRKVIQDIIDNFDIHESFLIMARNICGYHHEKYNGTGYPEGLKASQIPLEARIFALTDVYDAIRSKRPYKDEIAHSEAVTIISAEIGEHFDPDVVYAFLSVSDKFEDISDTHKENIITGH